MKKRITLEERLKISGKGVKVYLSPNWGSEPIVTTLSMGFLPIEVLRLTLKCGEEERRGA